MKTKPQRIHWTSDEDIRCAVLGGMGFSTKMIAENTGLTNCQISYRLHKGNIKRRDYRDGTSDVAARVMGYIPKSKADTRDLLKLKVIA